MDTYIYANTHAPISVIDLIPQRLVIIKPLLGNI